MAYATADDMIDRFGQAEVKSLAPALPATPPDAPAPYDAVRLERALADASAELDTYIAARYPTPLADPPPLLVKFACDLAREALDRQGRDMVVEAAKRARAWARDVSTGRATLTAGPGDDPETLPAAGGGAQVIAPDPVFDQAGLAGYLR